MYERHGDCRGCGLKCCTFLAFFAPRGVPAKAWMEAVRSEGALAMHAADPDDFIRWLDVHNVPTRSLGDGYVAVGLNTAQRKLLSLQRLNGKAALTIPAKCKHLLKDGKCGVYGKPERPKVCDDFPMHPDELIGIRNEPLTEPDASDCGYWFTKRSQKET